MISKKQITITLLIVALTFLTAYYIGINSGDDYFQEYAELNNSYIELNNNYNSLREIYYFESLEAEVSDQSTEIYDYYSLASEHYDINNYPLVINYCEKSRSISHSYSQDLRDIKAEYPDNPQEILELRKEMIEKEIEYLFALYESCEYFESAARAYQNDDYSTGGQNVDSHNVRIKEHDSLLEEYFNLNSRYNKLKRELLK